MNPNSFNFNSAGTPQSNAPMSGTPPNAAPASAFPSGTPPNIPQSPPFKPPKDSSGSSNIIKIILIVFFALTTGIAGYFTFDFYSKDTEAKTDLDQKIATAVAAAERDKTTELEASFAEREKNPYLTFAGPENYGSLTFEYPKTWSVYIEKDTTTDDEFIAYLNPVQINQHPTENINALRVIIRTRNYDDVIEEFKGQIEDGLVEASTLQIAGETANVFKTTPKNEEWQGKIVLIRIRDKVVWLKTDAEIFFDDFEKILASVTFNL